MNSCCNNRPSKNRGSNNGRNVAGANRNDDSSCMNLDGTPSVGGVAGNCMRNTGLVCGSNNNTQTPVFVQNNITQNCGCGNGNGDVSGVNSVVPYSSGETVTLSSEYNNSMGQESVLGFGTTQNDIFVNSQGAIPARQQVIAFSLPEDMCVRALTCTFMSTNTVRTNGAVYNIKAQIYTTGRTDSFFVPLNKAFVLLQPEIKDTVPEGTNFFGSVVNLNIFIPAGTRICLVLSLVKTSGDAEPITLLGSCNAGLSLSRTSNIVV